LKISKNGRLSAGIDSVTRVIVESPFDSIRWLQYRSALGLTGGVSRLGFACGMFACAHRAVREFTVFDAPVGSQPQHASGATLVMVSASVLVSFE